MTLLSNGSLSEGPLPIIHIYYRSWCESIPDSDSDAREQDFHLSTPKVQRNRDLLCSDISGWCEGGQKVPMRSSVAKAQRGINFLSVIQLSKLLTQFPCNFQDSSTIIQWEMEVYTIHMPLDSIHASGDLFVISEKTLAPFCCSSGDLFKGGKNPKQQVTLGVRISTLED